MNDVIRAYGNAFSSVLHPRMLALTIWPMLVALTLWLGLAWFYWDSWSQWLNATMTGTFATPWLSQRSLETLAHCSALLLLFLLLAPMILITAVLVAAVMEMPLIVNFVAARNYPVGSPGTELEFAL